MSRVGTNGPTLRADHARPDRGHPHLTGPPICIDDPLMVTPMAGHGQRPNAKAAHAAEFIGRIDSFGGFAGLPVSTAHSMVAVCRVNMEGTHGFRVDPTIENPAAGKNE